MSTKLPSIVGTIRIEPRWLEGDAWECDDSTLDLLLVSFARRNCLADDRSPSSDSVYLPTNRLNWPSPLDISATPLEANLTRLLDDLEVELELVDGTLS